MSSPSGRVFGILLARGPTLALRALLRRAEPRGRVLRAPRGEAAPVSRHDTEEEAEACRRAYERGLARDDTTDLVSLERRPEVLIRTVQPATSRCSSRAGSTCPASRCAGASSSRAPRSTCTSWRSSPRSTTSTTRRSARWTASPARGGGRALRAWSATARTSPRPRRHGASTPGSGAGCGAKLLKQLRAGDRERHPPVHRLASSPTMTSMLRLFQHLGEVTVTRRDGAVIEIEVEL